MTLLTYWSLRNRHDRLATNRPSTPAAGPGAPPGLAAVGPGPSVPAVKGNAGAIEQIAFSPDGSHLASAGDDTTVRLWTIDFNGWVAAVCHVVSGNLSLTDWSELVEGLQYERTCANDPVGMGAPESPAA